MLMHLKSVKIFNKGGAFQTLHAYFSFGTFEPIASVGFWPCSRRLPASIYWYFISYEMNITQCYNPKFPHSLSASKFSRMSTNTSSSMHPENQNMNQKYRCLLCFFMIPAMNSSSSTYPFLSLSKISEVKNRFERTFRHLVRLDASNWNIF